MSVASDAPYGPPERPGMSHTAAAENPHEKLGAILDSSTAPASGGGSPSDEDSEDVEVSEGVREVERPPLQHLTKEQVHSLKSLSQQDMLKVIDQMATGQRPFDDILRDACKDIISNREQAAAEQYKMEAVSLTSDSHDHMENDSVVERLVQKSQYVPLRLNYPERRLLRLLESALEVSEYTDKIDIYAGGSKARRICNEIRQICAILTGLVVAENYEDGRRLINDREFLMQKDFFTSTFEIGRRYKVLNPERMRDSYGKLIYLLQDSVKEEVSELLEFDLVVPITTVHSVLKKRDKLDLLRDPLVPRATQEIIPDGKTRAQIQDDIRAKESAIKALARKYGGGSESASRGSTFRFKGVESDEDSNEAVIRECLYSLGDHNCYLRFNRDPVEKMIQFLNKYFEPEQFEPEYKLCITAGSGGARLTHPHKRQYHYVLQSLTLWKEILHDMFSLWHHADSDLLSSQQGYALRDTGQGLNRIQPAPNVYRHMSNILDRVRRKVGSWVGSSQIHLGDTNVPNALMFIDKYVQVPRILGPLVLTLEKIPKMCKDDAALKKYVESSFRSVEDAMKLILADFFRHAFDGSGADNFYDAGSCIDGRLTSAWNWCSRIEKKAYFPLFLLTGFVGFDGRF